MNKYKLQQQKNYKPSKHTHKACSYDWAKEFPYATFSLAVDSTLLWIRAGNSGRKRVDPDPQQGEDGGKKNGPNNNNGRGTVLPSHETFKERVEMDNDPESKE